MAIHQILSICCSWQENDELILCIKLIKVTRYREGAWFKNNFAKVLSACNYYAGIATTSNAVSFRSLWNKSALQESVQPYLTQAQRYSRYTVQIFAVSFLKLCASIRPVFLVYSPHKYCWGTGENFFFNHSGCRKKLEKHLGLTFKIFSLACLKQSILETITDIAKSSCQSLEKVIEITRIHLWQSLSHFTCTCNTIWLRQPFLGESFLHTNYATY